MILHHNTATSFRLQEWPKSQGSHTLFFNHDTRRLDLSEIVSFVAEALVRANRPFVRHATFGLVNVTSPISNLSYGRALPPPKRIRSIYPLSFTFAMGVRDRYLVVGRPRHFMRMTANATLWGPTVQTAYEFLTITVPKQVTNRFGTLTMTPREMRFLYMAIGAFTKGFVRRNRFYDMNSDSYKNTLYGAGQAHSLFYHKQMLNLIEHVPYNDWVYNREMWTYAPNFLSPKSYRDGFEEFYCKHLWMFYRKYDTANVVEIEEKMRERLRSGALDLVSLLTQPQSSEPASEDLKLMMSILGERYHQFIPHFENIEQGVEMLLSNTMPGRTP